MKIRMKMFAAVCAACVMMAAAALTSFAGTVNPVTPGQQGRLPAFRYTDEAPYMNTILDYMTATRGQYYDAGDVMIPNFIIMKTDESNPQDIKVWGNFWINNYDLQGDNLLCKNGGEFPGLLHLRKTPAGYAVIGEDMVGDGSSSQPDSRRIFGVAEDLMRAYQNQDLVREQNRTNTIRKYVLQNNLSISTYQDYGWDKVQVR